MLLCEVGGIKNVYICDLNWQRQLIKKLKQGVCMCVYLYIIQLGGKKFEWWSTWTDSSSITGGSQ